MVNIRFLQIATPVPLPRRAAHCVAAAILLSSIAVTGCIENKVPVAATRQSFCRDKAAVDCHIYFDCFEDGSDAGVARRMPFEVEAGQVWRDKTDCIAQQQARCAPDVAVCEPGEIFQEMRATNCIAAWENISCESWSETELPRPPACFTDPANVNLDNAARCLPGSETCVTTYCTKGT